MQKNLEIQLNQLSLSTHRLNLRKFSHCDVEHNIQDELNEDLMQYIKEIESPEKIRTKTLECAQDWQATEGKWFLISLRLKETNDYIGLLCLRYISFSDRLVEIGWRLSKQYHSKGYAIEAANKLIEFLGEEIKAHKLIALIDSENESSIQLAMKLKMEKEAHLKKHFKIYNKWKDEVIFSIRFDHND